MYTHRNSGRTVRRTGFWQEFPLFLPFLPQNKQRAIYSGSVDNAKGYAVKVEDWMIGLGDSGFQA